MLAKSPAGDTEAGDAGKGGGVLGGGQHRRVHTLLVLPHLPSFSQHTFWIRFVSALPLQDNDVCKECGNAPTCVK